MNVVQERQRQRIQVNGTVQGVGFRPFVYRLANELGLGGFVVNRSDGVTIEVEGAPEKIDQFVGRLTGELPAAAHLLAVERTEVAPQRDDEFTIARSERDEQASTWIPPDLAVCDDCLRELFDSRDRRYCYPFINCTNCGPRYTIVNTIPYDRPKTSMRVFDMCEACAREYHDPSNRRFHAQPVACPTCGPKVWVRDGADEIPTPDPIALTVTALERGQIVAVRGLGGFHLTVDATNDDAVRWLRERKGRAEKPLAMMARNIAVIRRYCEVSDEEEALLESPSAPIVLLRRKKDNSDIAPSVAFDNEYYGFMLPYTPLHHLIMSDNFDVLVMTSGNLSEEPIAIDNDEAVTSLNGIADLFLLHDRDILQRCDDSIVRYLDGGLRIIRRARGFVPQPIGLGTRTDKSILAVGGELKNTVALTRGDQVVFSQHIGDLDNPSAMEFFEHCIEHLTSVLEIAPEVIACDMHPEYLSTKWADAQRDLPVIAVQHHHAHMASVMAEHGVEGPIVGLILDGTGYGLDGTIWGGEILTGDLADFNRFAWLEPVALPGGDAAIRQPWRMALSYLAYAFDGQGEIPVPSSLERIPETSRDLILRMARTRLNSPLTSSCGRLFDGIAALLGIQSENTYEAQAAMALEMAAMKADIALGDAHAADEALRAVESGPLSYRHLIRLVMKRLQGGMPREEIAYRFHIELAELVVAAVKHAGAETGVDTVGLSGGVFQNALFFRYTKGRLQDEGLDVLTHERMPTNDGGIALGQAVSAAAQLAVRKGRK